jgi:hypothetical protein
MPAREKRTVQKIPKLEQRIGPGRNVFLSGLTRPLCGANLATLDPPATFLASPR